MTIAGQRVQVIRRQGQGRRARVRYRVREAADGSIAGLLGASPGASTAVPAMFEVMERCFPDRYESWLPKLKEMVPSLGTKLSNEPTLFDEVWAWGSKVLGLNVSGPGASLEDVQPTEPGADTAKPATATA